MTIAKKHLIYSSFNKLLTLTLGIVAFGWLGLSLQAADGNIVGTWKASFTSADGQVRQSTLRIKKEGNKLIGTGAGQNGNEYPINEIKFTGDQLSLNIVRERNGEKFTMKVTATLNGDNLKGKLESNRGGENRTADWEAKRVTEIVTTASNATGDWKYAITLESGDVMKILLNLKQEGEKLTGKVKVSEFEAPITEGKIAGEAISFKIPVDIDGNKFTSTYKGTLSGDAIKGKIHSDWGGEDHNYDWNATREKTDASGTWKWVLVTAEGDSIDLSLKLKQDGEKLDGVVIMGDNEAPIAEGLVKDKQVTLKVSRERDGRTQTAKFRGELNGDSIKGKIDSDWSGESRIYDWNAKR